MMTTTTTKASVMATSKAQVKAFTASIGTIFMMNILHTLSGSYFLLSLSLQNGTINIECGLFNIFRIGFGDHRTKERLFSRLLYFMYVHHTIFSSWLFSVFPFSISQFRNVDDKNTKYADAVDKKKREIKLAISWRRKTTLNAPLSISLSWSHLHCN